MEPSKIVNGKGDWLLYGHTDASQTCIASWHLIDIKAIRAGLIRQATVVFPFDVATSKMGMIQFCVV